LLDSLLQEIRTQHSTQYTVVHNIQYTTIHNNNEIL